ncbi:FliG C-terminal domain-containing protein [Roseimaritima ulvae]|uniref:Flagellar motor switch protein FliG n=1 Tax=Roseimaritima ulvae TaxID=980254 RepID=A0A5B9QXJ8_9BACT|nr:FliG C-terminal domain-containing protein [Roseimaritima ulvae]QEG42732.1 Flagellar motor switch protein FliG [Roseimaritima ulvae]
MPQPNLDTQAAIRRTAILLSSLPAETSRQMLSKLPPLKRAMLKRAIAELSDVDPLERRQAMQQFLRSATAPPPADQRRATYSGDADPHSSSLAGAPPSGDVPVADTPLSFLGSVPDHVLLTAIEGEHPQTIAIVLASLQPQQAARLLPRLQDTTRNAAVQRLARLQQLPPDALDSIGEHLKKLVAEATPTDSSPAGSRTLQAILDQVPDQLRQDMSHQLGWPVPARQAEPARQTESDDGFNSTLRLAADTLATETLDFGPTAADGPDPDDALRTEGDRFTIDPQVLDQQFQQLRPTDVRDGLAQLDGQQALLAVCGLPARVADRVLGTLPRRQARKIRQQLQSLDSVTLEDIDRAKQDLGERLGIIPVGASAEPHRGPSRLLSAA